MFEEDKVLFLSCITGDQVAADKLYNKYKPILVRYIYKILRDDGIIIDFDECLSSFDEIFAVTLATYSVDGAPFDSYLYRVARNHCFSKCRNYYKGLHNPLKTVELDKNIADSNNSISYFYGKNDSQFESSYDMIFCSPEFEKLSFSKTEKLILYMRIEGFKLKEIATVTGLAVSTVQRILHKIKESNQLHKILTEMD